MPRRRKAPSARSDARTRAAALERELKEARAREARLHALVDAGQLALARAARLQEVTATLALATTPEQAAASVVEAGRAATGAFDGRLWLVAPGEPEVRLVYGSGDAARGAVGQRRIPLEGARPSPALDVIRSGEPVWLSSREAFHARYEGLAESAGCRDLLDFAIAGLPLTVEGRCIGALTFSFAGSRPFDLADTSFLLVLARHSAQALERGRLFEAERRARAAAEAAQERSAFLSEAAGRLASSLDYEATLAGVARLAVPGIADWITIDLADDFWRGASSAIVAHADPAKVELAQAVQRRFPPDPRNAQGLPEVLRSGRPELVPEITGEMLASAARSPEELAVLRSLGLRSSMIVPMPARGRILGAITFLSTRPERRYGPDDLEMAKHLARRAGLAIDNALLYREAQKAVRARDEVLAFVSHDLKTPLSAILLSASVLQEQSPDPRVVRYAQTIRRSSQRMDRLIRDLLDLSSMEAGRFKVEPRAHDAPGLIREAAALLQPLAAEKQIALEVLAEPPVPAVLADRDGILRVLSNLLSNAIAFTPPAGRVSLRCGSRGDEVEFAVADTGPGISDEDRHRVFERFWKSRDSQDGSGLGLAIARGIVEAHRGRIWFETRPGQGTTFCFALAAAERGDAPAATRTSASGG